MTAAGIGIYGVSVDSVFSHQAFADHLGGLPYELLADFERSAVEEWGVMRTDVPGYRGMPTRSIFIVDAEGTIRWTWIRTKEEPLPDYDQVVAEARKVAASGDQGTTSAS